VGQAGAESGLGRFIKESTREYLLQLARVSSMGLAMVIATVLGLAAGYMVDRNFGTQPWGFFIGLGLGIAAGFRNLYVLYKRTEASQERMDQETKQGK
jgi:ATP synthase protein I